MVNSKIFIVILILNISQEAKLLMSKRIFANLGFLLQISGILTVIPIGIGIYFGEINEIVPLFITCTAFLCIGFLCNSLCERKDLNLKSSSTLLIITFIILPLIGSIPYIYLNPFNSTNNLDLVSNSYFESTSGFTTTGFSFIADSYALPKSLLVFRSLTEIMGGIGIVFIILAFFQSKKSLLFLGNTIGIENTNGNYRKMFLWVFAIYGLFIVAFTGIYYALGFTDLIKTGTFVIDTLTGGFSPTEQQMAQYVFPASKILMILLMTFGAINFAFNYHLLTGKLRKLFTKEVILFFSIIALASLSIFLLTKLEFIDALFHVVSMTSATGIKYVDIFSINSTVTAILITLIVIGGCSFSMSGGIRISRIVTFLGSIKSAILLAFVKGSDGEFTVEREDGLEHQEQFPIVVSVLLLIGLLLIFAIVFSTIGISFTDSLLEMGSAFSTNGVTLGAINVGMPLVYKWLVVAAMTIGRVEILTILLFLIPIMTHGTKSHELR